VIPILTWVAHASVIRRGNWEAAGAGIQSIQATALVGVNLVVRSPPFNCLCNARVMKMVKSYLRHQTSLRLVVGIQFGRRSEFISNALGKSVLARVSCDDDWDHGWPFKISAANELGGCRTPERARHGMWCLPHFRHQCSFTDPKVGSLLPFREKGGEEVSVFSLVCQRSRKLFCWKRFVRMW
jgi:hypothetical protein